MNEDIHKWTEGRYTLMFDEHTFFVWDNEKEKRMTALRVTKKLNEQQDQITSMKAERKKLKEENKRLRYRSKDLYDYNNQLLKKTRLTDVLPNAIEIIASNNELVEENERLRHLKVLANAFIVEKGLEGEFIKWSKENESSSKKDCGD